MTDKQEKVPHIGIAALWISSIFLFNPAVAVFDPLPDVIGYLLLYIGLAHISAVCPYFERAQKGFSRMLIASAVVLPALLFVRLLAAKSEQDSLLLLLTFVYSTAEWVLAVPAWRALFAATRHNGVGIGRRSLFAGRGKNRKRASRNDSLARYTTFFWILKPLLVLAPELSLLSVSEKGEGYFRFRNLFRLFSVTLLLIFGTIWLIRMIVFFARLSRDRGFCRTLDEKYRVQVLSHPEVFIKRKIRLAFILMGVGTVLLTDFSVSHINLLPDTVGAGLILCGCALLRPYSCRFRGAVTAAGIYAVFSAGFYAYNLWFILRYGEPRAAMHTEAAYRAYLPIPVFSCIGAVLFLLMLWMLARMLCDVIHRYAGYTMLIETARDPEEKVRAVRRQLCTLVMACMGCGLLPAAAGVLYDFTQPYLLNSFFERLPFLRFVLDVSFASFACYVLYRIRQEVEYQYRTV